MKILLCNINWIKMWNNSKGGYKSFFCLLNAGIHLSSGRRIGKTPIGEKNITLPAKIMSLWKMCLLFISPSDHNLKLFLPAVSPASRSPFLSSPYRTASVRAVLGLLCLFHSLRQRPRSRLSVDYDSKSKMLIKLPKLEDWLEGYKKFLEKCLDSLILSASLICKIIQSNSISKDLTSYQVRLTSTIIGTSGFFL